MQFQLVLYGHGSRDPDWFTAFQRLADSVRSSAPTHWEINSAFLQFITPSLDDTVKHAISQGATEIHILPIFLFPGQHVKHDIPATVAGLQAAFPDIMIRLASPIGEHPSFRQLVNDCALAIIDEKM